MGISKTYKQLELEVNDLLAQLQEANDIIDAIRGGEIDALVVKSATGPQLYTLKSADQTYRVFIEKMNEGAVTMNQQGLIVYCNTRFAEMVNTPLFKVMGQPFLNFIADDYLDICKLMISQGWQSESKGEISIVGKDNALIHVLLSLTTLELDEGTALSIILSDLTDQKKIQAQLQAQNKELDHAQKALVKMNNELEEKVRERTRELLISREHFAIAINAADLGTWNFDPVTQKFIGNDRLKSWFGLPVENEMSLDLALDVIDSFDRPRVVNAIAKALEISSNGVYDIDYTIKNQLTGEERVVRARGKAFFNNDGTAYRFSGTLQDITEDVRIAREQVLAKNKIEELEERARLAVEAAGLGTFDLNLRTGEFITSAKVDEIFGIDLNRGHASFVHAIHPEDRVLRDRAHAEALRTGRLLYIARIRPHGNDVAWIKTQGRVFYNEEGKPERILGTVIDITEQQNAEEILLNINQRLEIALEAGRLGSYELEVSTGMMSCTKQCKENYGLAEDEAFNYDDLINAILPEFRAQVMEAVSIAVASGKNYMAEYKVKHPDGTVRWIKASGVCRYDLHGKATKMVGITSDITDQKDLQKQKDDFIGIASHELKTPVTIIKAYTQLLEKLLTQKGEAKEAIIVTKMDAQINRLTSLIGDLLDVTKINSGKLQFNDCVFDFSRCVKNTVEELQRTTEKHTLLENAPDTPIMVFADEERIGQVITNLITNAIKYSPNADRILIQTNCKEKEVIFCVQDFGIGIPEEKQEKVFEQFYRVSGDMQHTFPGLGLGLFIASDIIYRAGGRIWVESKLNHGSTFCFSLPLMELERSL